MKVRFLTVAIAVLSFFGCAHRTLEWSDRTLPASPYIAGDDYVEIRYPKAAGGAAAEPINRTIEAYLHSVFGLEDVSDSIPLAGVVDSLLARKERDSTIRPLPYDLRVMGKVGLCGHVASVRIETYMLTGGAHGDMRVRIMNFDLRDGKRLDVSDLFTDTMSLAALNRVAFKKMLFDKGLSEDVLFVEPDRLPLPSDIGIDSSGVTMHYDPYRIAPYVFGKMEYLIPYDEAKPLLRQIARR